MADAAPNMPAILGMTRDQLIMRYHRSYDVLVPHVLPRWLGFLALLALYGLRVWLLQGWYIVTYALGIFLLNNLIGFITPQVRGAGNGARPFACRWGAPRRLPRPLRTPRSLFYRAHPHFFFSTSFSQVDPESEGATLPRHTGDDSKPSFTPKMGEFKFWKLSVEGIAFATLLTFFSMFNVLVYWPILVLYFLLLLVITMQKKIAHMIKWKCVRAARLPRLAAACRLTTALHLAAHQFRRYLPCSCKAKKQYGSEKGGKGGGGGGGPLFSGSSASK